MKDKLMDGFIGKYPLSKTLRFELKPVGKTLAHIEAKGLLAEDTHRAESYQKVKKLIDRFHKPFIEEVLDSFCFSENELNEFLHLYNLSKKSDAEQKEFSKIQAQLRKTVAQQFKKHPHYQGLFKKELIRHDLFELDLTPDEKEMVLYFGKFTTYFKGFHDNRENMYSNESKSTAIAYRIIHQNLPKFIDNLKAFEKVKAIPDLLEKFGTIEQELAAILQGKHLDEIFTLDFFSQTLSQKGIDEYNEILGGYTDPNNASVKYKGLNEYINLYNQKAPKNERVGKLTRLFKQILSDRESISFLPEFYEDDQAVLESIRIFHESYLDNLLHHNEDSRKSLIELLKNLNSFDLSHIYITNERSLSDISQKMFGDWGRIQTCLFAQYDATYAGKKKKKPEKYAEERKNYFKRIESFSLESLNEALTFYNADKFQSVADYFSCLGKDDNGKNLPQFIDEAYQNIISLVQNRYPEDKNLSNDVNNVEKIKTYLDSVNTLLSFIKPFNGKGTDPDKDARFYGDFNEIWQELRKVTPLYNSVRNYMTRKSYSTEKIKLNFENPELMGGWSREIATSCLLLKDDKYFYLGIMDKKSKSKLKHFPAPENDRDIFYKMKYAQVADPKQDVPGLMVIDGKTVKKNGRKEKEGAHAGENLILEDLKNQHLPQEINTIRKLRTYLKTSDYFSSNDLIKYIDFYKQRVVEYFVNFEFEFKDSKDYHNFDEFLAHVNAQAYQVSFKPVSLNYINSLVESGKLYLFQIYNKDFSPYSKGTPNLHTLYFKALFDEVNLKDVVYKLNCSAEIFYRKASPGIKKDPTHYKNKMVKNKNPLNPKKKSVFEYDLIKDKRYTVDKFQFHVPITLNFKAEGWDYLNTDVNRCLKTAENFHVIGIDRGERHLLYLTVIDPQGKIVEQYSLNQIVNEHQGRQYETNYHDLLSEKEKGRDEARKNWQTIENIKELKEGYLSQVIHKIAQLMVKYDAIVVLEDLNFGFMRGRQKVEKQVYQKFEKMLIDKLNYLVDKTVPVNSPGGLLKAYQLTSKFESFQKLGKQSGFLFYIPAWNTSKMDPTTGFVNLFNGKELRYESVDKALAFFDKFDRIAYNQAEEHFEFAFDYSNFTYKAEGSQTRWILCSHGQRIHTFRNPQKNSQWDSETIDLTAAYKALFKANDINFHESDLKAAILTQSDKAFFVELLSLLRLTLQMRNSITGSDVDYLISPVKNCSDAFFDSRQNRPGLPENADANGAYNIARKGLWIIEQLKEKELAELDKPKLAISNKEWLAYAQSHQQ